MICYYYTDIYNNAPFIIFHTYNNLPIFVASGMNVV